MRIRRFAICVTLLSSHAALATSVCDAQWQLATIRQLDGSSAVALPGTFRVEITANRLTGEKVTTRFSSQPVQLEEQYIPDKYNTSSELEITIVPNAGRITQDYELID